MHSQSHSQPPKTQEGSSTERQHQSCSCWAFHVFFHHKKNPRLPLQLHIFSEWIISGAQNKGDPAPIILSAFCLDLLEARGQTGEEAQVNWGLLIPEIIRDWQIVPFWVLVKFCHLIRTVYRKDFSHSFILQHILPKDSPILLQMRFLPYFLEFVKHCWNLLLLLILLLIMRNVEEATAPPFSFMIE